MAGYLIVWWLRLDLDDLPLGGPGRGGGGLGAARCAALPTGRYWHVHPLHRPNTVIPVYQLVNTTSQ